ncbi:hypothetical protein [Nocardia niigatensis]
MHTDTVVQAAQMRDFDPGASARHAGRYVLAVALAGAWGVGWVVAHADWATAAAAVPLAAEDARGCVSDRHPAASDSRVVAAGRRSDRRGQRPEASTRTLTFFMIG